jgi:hypothetical protein
MSSLDPEVGKKVARKVLEETLHVKPGENVTVETWNNGLQFARIVVSKARRSDGPCLVFQEGKKLLPRRG